MARTAKPGPPNPAPARPWRGWTWLLTFSVGVLLLLLFWIGVSFSPVPELSYTDFVSKVDADRVEAVTVDDREAVRGTLRDGSEFRSRLPSALGTGGLGATLAAKGVRITAEESDSGWGSVLSFVIPLVLLVALFSWIGRRVGSVLEGGTGFGRSRAKVIEAERPITRFSDVAGYEGVKQEVSEVVDFLRDPGRYAAAGGEGATRRDHGRPSRHRQDPAGPRGRR